MIECQDLHKFYGSAHALRGITFGVERGEVVGFLGPNGAGKSTTMKILTGYLRPSRGVARVMGLDVVSDSLAVRRRIGYLPESTPLYTEMRVDEYLAFAAAIRGVRGKDARAAVARVVAMCGLDGVVGKDIIELSKGFRQRVGLAQALVHEPDLLILDEPTSGLDPNQIVEVRGLIERLREHHTVILSTHYLQEVEAAASRIVIVDQGRIVADGSHADLIARLPAGPLRLVVQGLDRDAAQALGGTATAVADGGWQVDLDAAAAEQDPAGRVVAAGGRLVSMQRIAATLEDVFRKLTRGAEDDARAAADAVGEEVVGHA